MSNTIEFITMEIPLMLQENLYKKISHLKKLYLIKFKDKLYYKIKHVQFKMCT